MMVVSEIKKSKNRRQKGGGAVPFGQSGVAGGIGGGGRGDGPGPGGPGGPQNLKSFDSLFSGCQTQPA